MVNMHDIITIDKVNTAAERAHFLTQECTNAGLVTSFWTYIAGIVGIPLLLRTAHKRIPIGVEYQVAAGALLSMVISYYAGTNAKKKCEEDIKRQLAEKLMS